MTQLFNEDDRSLSDCLKQFLDFQSKAEPRTQFCTQCGSVCMSLPAQVWLDGDKEVFNICLPFCAHCNPEFFAQMPEVA